MASVSVNNLFASYSKKRTMAVDGVSFDVKDGELFVILGPSGCGKTTILHCIAGLIRPDKGTIKIGDRVVTSTDEKIFVRPQDRNVAMVFQEYALYPNLTVRDNLAFPLECQGLPKKQILEKVQEVAELLGISELLNRRPAQLSGGQRQRCALGRALVRNPSVFLLDEPLGNLDAQLRVQVRYELRRIQRQLKATMVYVTHDQVEAMTLADKVILMRNGRIEQLGTPLELYEEPKNLFVASFIGSPPMNLFEAKVQRRGELVVFDAGIICVEASQIGIRPSEVTGERVLLGIRPSDVGQAPSTPADIQLNARVDLIEPLGDGVIVHAFVQEKPLTAKWDKPLSTVGPHITLFISPRRIQVFQLPSGARMPKDLGGNVSSYPTDVSGTLSRVAPPGSMGIM